MHESNQEMNARSIPASVKAMLRAEDATSSHDINELLARYLRVRDSSSIDRLEHELTALFASGVERAAQIIAGLEELRHTSSPVAHTLHVQLETNSMNSSPARSRVWRGNYSPLRSDVRTGASMKP